MTPEIETLKKLAEAAKCDSVYWWPLDELEDSNIVLDKDDAAYIAAVSPDVVLALLQENEAQAAEIKEREAERDANFAAFHETCVISAKRGSEIDALRAQLSALQGGELPELPEWCKQDNLGGLVPSEVRSALSQYARQAVAMARAKMVPLTDAELIRMAVNAGFGTYCEGYPDGVLWFDENPMELLKKVSAHGITGEPK